MFLDYASQGFSIKQRALHLILKNKKKKKNQVKDLICYDCGTLCMFFPKCDVISEV